MLQRLPMKGLSIIYEDTDILIADKPYNMLSQKSKEQDLSANEYLLGYLIRSGALSLETFGTFRPSVCNRLDRNTTGLLLMGKTLAGAQMLSEGLRERTIHKFYRAIVSGNVTKPVHLSGWLIKDEHTNQVKILTQGGPGESTNLIVYSIYRDAFFNFRFGSAAAQSVVLFIIIMALTLVMFKVEKKGVKY